LCIGIEDLNGTQKHVLSIFPNPNNGSFTIETTSDMTLNIINGLGEIIRTITLSASHNYQTSVTNLPDGVYFIVDQKANMGIKQKIVVTP